MTPPQLTIGVVRSLLDASLDCHQHPPTMQVLRVIKVPKRELSSNNSDRYRIVLSDGQHLVQGLLAVQLNHLVDSGELVDGGFAVVRLIDYMSNTVGGARIIVALKMTVADKQYGRRIGDPVDVPGIDSSIAAARGDTSRESGVEDANKDNNEDGDDVTVAYDFDECFPNYSDGKSVPPSAGASSLHKLGASISEEFKCPISLELMVDPVTAADGFLYERDAIEEFFEYLRLNSDILDVRSPKTNLPMKSTHLMDAVAIRNAICYIVNSGAFGTDVIAWYDRMTRVAATKKKARDHDVESMELLSLWYKEGSHGLEQSGAKARHWHDKAAVCALERRAHGARDAGAMCQLGSAFLDGSMSVPKDPSSAFRWFEMAADLVDPDGMANAGDLLVRGVGVEQDTSRGVTLIAASAAMRSGVGCFRFGELYFNGMCGGVCFKRASLWLEMALKINGAVDGALSENQVGSAETMLQCAETMLQCIRTAE